MNEILDILIATLLLTDMMLLASSRLAFCIKAVAFQGLIIGLMPVLISGGGHENREILLIAIVNIAMKCLVLPFLLNKASKMAHVQREIEPFISYPVSIMLGISGIAISFWACSGIALPDRIISDIATPAAISMIFTGLLLVISRKKALTQALGYLVFENGIYFFGTSLFQEHSLIVELGILLDVFVLIFVMGIAVFHISREFDHIDTDKMQSLGDWEEEIEEKEGDEVTG